MLLCLVSSDFIDVILVNENDGCLLGGRRVVFIWKICRQCFNGRVLMVIFSYSDSDSQLSFVFVIIFVINFCLCPLCQVIRRSRSDVESQ